MKFRNLGRVTLALAASLALAFGAQSCTYNYTQAYIIITGSQYNQVASYRESTDDGQLRPAPGNPASSGGTYPIRSILLNGGRYFYVLNQGKPTVQSDGSIQWSGANVSLFAIGGDGHVTYQLSYPSSGLGSLRLAMSTNGSFLYVLDEYQPGPTNNVTPASSSKSAAYPCYDATNNVWRPAGDITVFSIDPATGRLFLVQNQQQQNAQGTPLSFFPVGCGPIDFHMGSGFLYTAEASDPASGNPQVVYSYAANAINGQLTQVPGGAQPTGASSISVIGGSANGSYVYVLDNGANKIYSYTPGTNGLLSAVSGGAIPNASTAAGMEALTTDSASKYLYIANTLSPGLNQPGSQLSEFIINPNGGVLTPTPQPTYGVGSTPVCVFEDPSHQYFYTANAGSSTVTGAAYDPLTGDLKNLSAGSTFPVIGTPTWCMYSSNTD